MIKQIGLPLRGRPILLITRMITDRIGLHSVLLPLLIIIIIIMIIIIIIIIHCLIFFLLDALLIPNGVVVSGSITILIHSLL